MSELHPWDVARYSHVCLYCISSPLQRACPQGTPSGRLGGQCPVTVLRSTKSTSSRAVTGAARVDGSPGANNPCSQDSWNCMDDFPICSHIFSGEATRTGGHGGPWQSKDLSCTLQPQARPGLRNQWDISSNLGILEEVVNFGHSHAIQRVYT